MTTNVLDFKAKRITSDSRWSLMIDKYFCYVDDSGFDKIANRTGAAMICAGDARLIDQWKQWFQKGDPDADLPDTYRTLANGQVSDVCISIIEKPIFTVDCKSGSYHAYENFASFCGSGGTAALSCYASNGCSFRCVETASKHDIQTGGSVKFVEIDTQKHNLGPANTTYADLEESFLKRGKIMNLVTGEFANVQPIDEGVLRQALSAGTVALTAPTGHAPRAWTEEEKQAARDAMRRIIAREQASNQD
ncbi:hypothetical protein [Stenotrophomonas maltophilia]|uniref:hypothetical protein n=1 Tax=Stenotrophomonas maltophilia TaxID=40324 RepID=UPI000C154FA6|nr:hypothetical protein [Stenotrophomonas maltophilia]